MQHKLYGVFISGSKDETLITIAPILGYSIVDKDTVHPVYAWYLGKIFCDDHNLRKIIDESLLEKTIEQYREFVFEDDTTLRSLDVIGFDVSYYNE